MEVRYVLYSWFSVLEDFMIIKRVRESFSRSDRIPPKVVVTVVPFVSK